jgi:hypothetical protein
MDTPPMMQTADARDVLHPLYLMSSFNIHIVFLSMNIQPY